MAGGFGRPELRAGSNYGTWCRRSLALIWICFLIRGLAYSVALPIWEGYDEWSHFAYIQQLANGGGLPDQTASRVSLHVAGSLQAAPLSWTQKNLSPRTITHDMYWKLTAAERYDLSEQLAGLPAAQAAMPSEDGPVIYEAQQPPLYYWLMSIPLRLNSTSSIVVQVFNLRLLNVLIASFFVPLCFLLARRVWRDDSLALSCAALAVAMPELLIHVLRITNDTLGLVLFTGLLLLALNFADDPTDLRIAIAAGTILGLGLLTKAYFLTALPAILAVAILYCRKNRADLMRAAAACWILIGVAAAISVLWFWHNFKSTGAWSGLAEDVMLSQFPLLGRLSQFHRVNWLNALDSVFNSHVWFGGWSFLTVRSWMYHVFRSIVLAGVIGVIVVLARRKETTPGLSRRTLGVLTIFYTSFLVGLCYHVLEIFLARGESTSTGWYLYSLVAAEAILLTVGLRAIVGERFQRFVVPALLVCYTVLDLYAFNFVLLPYHAGFISHRPDGSLLAFRISQMQTLSFTDLVGRFLINRPEFLNGTLVIILWCAYWLASAYLLGMVIRANFGRATSTVQGSEA